VLPPAGTPENSLNAIAAIDAPRTRNGLHAELLNTPVNQAGFAINPTPVQELKGVTLNRASNPRLKLE
jgi:hypothetical protein